MNNKLIAVSIGDIKGIGIHLLIKIFLNKKLKNFVLFSNKNIFNKHLKEQNIKIKINVINNKKNKLIYNKNYLNIYDYKVKNKNENTIMSIRYAHQEYFKNNFIGLVTLPLRKDLIKNHINKNFVGHTEYLQNMEKAKYSNMILYHNKIMVSPLTTHIKIESVSKIISKKNFIYNQVVNLNNILIKDFNILKPKIIISGLNPHSGENGTIGKEEIKTIIPQIKKIKKRGINIFGPSSADSMLTNLKDKNYDCYVFLYHDQALIPFKYISNFSGVNYTGNLKIIRTSPDHGTAYDLINSKNASTKSLLNSFKLIKVIYRNRIKYAKTKKIIKSKFFN